MKQHLLLAYASTFVSLLLEKEVILEQVSQIIVFGSVARGDFDETSDLDLFIDIKNLGKKKFVETTVKETLVQFEIVAENTWSLRNIRVPLKTICGSLHEPQWKNLNNELIGTGIVLYGRYAVAPDGLSQYCLVHYSLSQLSQKKKMLLLRTLYGCCTTKSKKKYESPGIISSLNAKKIGANQLLVSIADLKKITDLLKQFKLPFSIQEVWLRYE